MSPIVAFLGNGLTASGNWAEWLPKYDVINLGVSGNTTADLLTGLDAVVALSPDVVVVEVGTNDIGDRKTDEHVVRNVEMTLCILRRQLPQAGILVQSVLPRGRDFTKTICSVNRHLRQFAPTQRAQYLDLWPALAGQDGELIPAFAVDSLHLTPEGYNAWLVQLRQALQGLIERAPSTTARPVSRP